jgi:hypothetical protein
MIDVRFFPQSTQGNQRAELDDQVRKAMEQMDNLESLVWTVSPPAPRFWEGLMNRGTGP